MLLMIGSHICLIKRWIYDNLLHLHIIPSWIDPHTILIIELSFKMSRWISLIIDYYLCIKRSEWVILFKVVHLSSTRSIVLYASIVPIKQDLALHHCGIAWGNICIASVIRERRNLLRTLIKVVLMCAISWITCCSCLDISLRKESMSQILGETLS